MKLAKEETLIKEWEYAETTVKGQKSISKLTVTNKRIVADTEGRGMVDRQEIPMSAVKGVHCRHKTPSIIPAIILIAIGVIVAIMGFKSCDEKDGEIMLLFGLIVGALFVFKGIDLLNRSAFMLEITTYGAEGHSLYLRALSILQIQRKRKIGKLKIRVNKEVVMDIIETLGAIIAENQKA